MGNLSNFSESPWPSSNGIANNREVIQPYLDVQPKKAPLFITVSKTVASFLFRGAQSPIFNVCVFFC